MERFEFFPIKCRIRRAAEVYRRCEAGRAAVRIRAPSSRALLPQGPGGPKAEPEPEPASELKVKVRRTPSQRPERRCLSPSRCPIGGALCRAQRSAPGKGGTGAPLRVWAKPLSRWNSEGTGRAVCPHSLRARPQIRAAARLGILYAMRERSWVSPRRRAAEGSAPPQRALPRRAAGEGLRTGGTKQSRRGTSGTAEPHSRALLEQGRPSAGLRSDGRTRSEPLHCRAKRLRPTRTSEPSDSDLARTSEPESLGSDVRAKTVKWLGRPSRCEALFRAAGSRGGGQRGSAPETMAPRIPAERQ